MNYATLLTIVCCFMILQASHGERIKLNNPLQCSTKCSASTDVYTFTEGKDFLYDLESKHSYTNASGSKATFVIKGQVRLQALSRCEFGLQLEVNELKETVEPGSVSNDYASFKEELQGRPLRFGFDNGRVTAICPERVETEKALNLKRGILSALQITLDDLQTPSYHLERDISGDCFTEYRIGTTNNDLVEIEKSKNIAGCANRFSYSSNSAGILNDQPKETSQAPLIEGEQLCKYKINKRGPLQSVSCTENNLVNPVFEGKGTSIVVEHSLQYVKNEAKKSIEIKPESRTDLLFEAPTEFPSLYSDLRDINAAGVTSLLTDAVKKVNSRSSSQNFLRLVFALRQLNEKDIQAVQASASSSVSKALFYDALAATQTDAAVSVLLKALTNPAEEEFVQGFLLSANFMKKPSAKIIAEIQTLYDNNKYRSLALLLSSGLIKKHCSQSPSCFKNKEITAAFSRIEAQVRTGCSGSNAEQALSGWKALGNIGNFPGENTNELLNLCKTNLANQFDVQIAAVQAVQRLSCSAYGVNKFLTDAFESDVDTELRIKAYLSLVRCPQGETLNNISKVLREDKNQQVTAFVWSHLAGVSTCSDPAKAELKKAIAPFLNELATLSSRLNLDSLSHSKYYEKTYRINEETETNVQSSVIFGQKSFIPQFTNLNVTLNLYGRAINLFDVGVSTSGLENLFNQAKQALTRQNDVIAETLSKEFKSFDGKFAARGAQTIGISLKIFGSEVLFVKDILTNTKTANVVQQIYQLLSGKAMNINCRRNLFVSESGVTFPSVSGFPLQIQMFAASTVDLSVQAQFQLDTLKIETKLSPKVSVYSVTRYLLNTGFNSLGLTSEVNFHSNTTLETGFEFMNRATEGRKLRAYVNPIPESQNLISVRRQVTQNFGPSGNFQPGLFSSISAPQKCSGKSLEAVFGGTICVAYKRAISNLPVNEVTQQSFFYEISIVNFVGYIFHLEHKPGTKSTTLPERFILQAGLQNDANRMILFNFTEISNGYSFDTNIPYVGRYALNAAWKTDNVLEGELQKDGKGLIKLKGFMDGAKTRWVLRDEKEDWIVFQLEDGKADSSKSLEFTLKRGFPITLKMSSQNYPERMRNVITLKLGEDYRLKWEFSSTKEFQLNKKNEWNTQFEWKKKEKTLIEFDGRIDLERRDGLSAQVPGVAGKLFSISVSNKFEGEVADKKRKFALSTGFSAFASNGLLKGGANLDEPVVLESEFNWRYPETPKRNINYSLFTYLKKPTQANGNFTFLFEGKVPEGLTMSSCRHFAQLAWKSDKFPFDGINFQIQSDNIFGQKFNLHFNHEVNFPKSVQSAFKLDGFGLNLVIKSTVTDLKSHALLIKYQGVNILMKTEIRFERTSTLTVELKHKLFVEKDMFAQGTTNVKWEASGPISIDVALKLTKLNGDFNINTKLFTNKGATAFANQGIESTILLTIPSQKLYFKHEFNLREQSNSFKSKWTLQLSDEKPAKRFGYDLTVNLGDNDVLIAAILTILLPGKEYPAIDISISRIPMKDYRIRLFSFRGDEISYFAKLLPSNDPTVIPVWEKFVFDLSSTFRGIYYESEREQTVTMSPSKTKLRVDIKGKDKSGSKTAEWCNYKLEENFEFEGGAIKFSLKYSHDLLTKYLGLTVTEFALDIVPAMNPIMQLTAQLSWRMQNQAENQFVKTTLEWEGNPEKNQYGLTGKVDIKILDKSYSLKVKDTIMWNGREFGSKMDFNWKSNTNDFQLTTDVKFADIKKYKFEITTNSPIFRTFTLSSDLEEKKVKTLTKKFNFDISNSKFDLNFKLIYGNEFSLDWNSNIKVIENGQIGGSRKDEAASLQFKWTEGNGSTPRWFAFNISDATVGTKRNSQFAFRSEFGKIVTSVFNVERSKESVNVKMNGNINIDKIFEIKLDQVYFILASPGESSSLGYTFTMNTNYGSQSKLFEKATVSWKYDGQRLSFINITDVIRYNDALLCDFVLDTALGKFLWELDLSKFMPPNLSQGIYISLLLPTWDINDFSFTGTLQFNPYIAKTFLKVDLFNGFITNAVRNDPQGGPTKFLVGLDFNSDYLIVDRLYSYFSLSQKQGNTQKADFYYEFSSSLLANQLKGYFTSEVTNTNSGIEATLKSNGVSAYSVSSTWKDKEFTFTLKDLKGVNVPINFEVQHVNSWIPLKLKLEVTQLGKIKGSIKAGSKAGFNDFSLVYEMNNNAGVVDISGSYSGWKDYNVVGKVNKIQGVTLTVKADSKAFTTPSSTSGVEFTLATELEYEKWLCNKCEMKAEYRGSFFDSEMSMLTRVNGLDRLRYSEEIRLVKFDNIVMRASFNYPDLTEMSFDVQRNLREGRMSFKISNIQLQWNLVHDYTSALLSVQLEVANQRYQFRTNLQRIIHVAARRAYYDPKLSMYDNILPIGFGYTLQLNEGYVNFTRESSNKINLRAYHPSFPGQPLLVTMQYEIQPTTIKFTLTGKTPWQKVKEMVLNINVDVTEPTFTLELNFQDVGGQWNKNSLKLDSEDETYRLSVDHTCSQYELKSFVSYNIVSMKNAHKFDLTDSQFNKTIYSSESECAIETLLFRINKSGVCELKVNNGEKLRILSLRLNDETGTSSVEFAWDKEKFGALVLSTKSETSGDFVLKNYILLSPVRNLYLQTKFYASYYLPSSVSLFVNHHSGRADKTGHFQLNYEMQPQRLDLTFSSNMIQQPIVTRFETASNEFKLSIRFKNNPTPFFINSYKIILDEKMTLKVPIFLSMNNKQWNAEFYLDRNAPNFKLYFQVFGSQPQIYAIEYNPMQNFLIQAGNSFLFQVSFFKESFSSVVNTALKYEPDSQVANMTYESSVAPFKFVWRLNTNTRSWKFNLRAVSKRAYMASLSQVTADGTKLQDATFHSQYDLNNLLKWELTWRKEFIEEYKTFFFDATNPSRLSRIFSYYQAAVAEQRSNFLSEFGRPFVTSLNIGTIIDFVKSVVNDVDDSWKELGRIYENNDFYLKSIFGRVTQSSPLYVIINLPTYVQFGDISQVNISKPVEFFKQVHQTIRELFNGLNMQKIEGCLQVLTNAYSKFLQVIQVYASSGQKSASKWTSNLDFGGTFRAFTKLLSSVISDDAWVYLSELLQEAIVMFGQFNIEGLNSGVSAGVTSLKQLREDVTKFFADVQELVTVIYGSSYSEKKDSTPAPTPSYKPEININTQAGKITFQSYVSPSAFAVLSGLKFFSEYVPNELVNTAFRPSVSLETLFYRGEYLFSRYGSKSKMWSLLPPFSRSAWILKNRYYITYDGAAGHVVPGCRYLVTRDFANQRFSIVLDAKDPETSNLFIQVNDRSYHISSSGQVSTVKSGTTDLVPRNLPYAEHDNHIKVERDGQRVRFTWKHLLTVDLYTLRSAWSFTLAGVLHGQVDGLLGSNNVHLFDDYQTASGSVSDDNTARLKSWTSGECSALNANNVRFPEANGTHFDCQDLFVSRKSHLSRCFNVIDPRPYRDICYTYPAPRSAEEIQNHLCMIENAYVLDCQRRDISVRMCSKCTKCGTIREGDSVESTSPKLNRFIFIVEQGSCTEAELPFIKKLAIGLKGGNPEDQFSLITFDSEKVNQVTLGFTGTQGSAKDLETALDNFVKTSKKEASVSKSRGLEAIFKATLLQTKQESRDQILLFTCSSCSENRKYPSVSVQNALTHGGIALHHFSSGEFTTGGIDGIIGLDGNKFYRNAGGFKEGEKTEVMRPPKGECTALAAPSKGAVWSLNRAKEFIVPLYEKIKKGVVLSSLRSTCQCRTDQYGSAELECRHLS